MTRGHTRHPVWTWNCDECSANSGDFAASQDRLPTPDQMRARGWFIAKLWGDLCPRCATDPAVPREGDNT